MKVPPKAEKKGTTAACRSPLFALKKTLIAGTDPVALDAYAAKAYWDLDWHTLRYLKLASERGLGTLSFETARSRFVTL